MTPEEISFIRITGHEVLVTAAAFIVDTLLCGVY